MVRTPAANFLHLQLSEILTRKHVSHVTRGHFLGLYCSDQLKLQSLRDTVQRKHLTITLRGLITLYFCLFRFSVRSVLQ
jgi:hypothetical protein